MESEVIEPEIIEQTEELPHDLSEQPEPEPTVLAESQTDFRDGVFRPAFEALGYNQKWKTGERREIPVSLFMKLNKRSGNKFSIVKR